MFTINELITSKSWKERRLIRIMCLFLFEHQTPKQLILFKRDNYIHKKLIKINKFQSKIK
jgi:hypothetical protein